MLTDKACVQHCPGMYCMPHSDILHFRMVQLLLSSLSNQKIAAAMHQKEKVPLGYCNNRWDDHGHDVHVQCHDGDLMQQLEHFSGVFVVVNVNTKRTAHDAAHM